MTPIGALRTRLHLEMPAPDAGGAIAWEAVGVAWARMVTAADIARPAVRFELRMRRDVRPGWRVTLGARRFRITAVRDGDNRNARLLLDCEEETP